MEFIVHSLFRICGHLPLALLHRLGTALGWLIWLASPTYRRHLRHNLALATGDAAAARLRARAITAAGQQMLEIAYLWQQPQERAQTLVQQVSGRELVEAARANGRGVLFLTPHLGCFEITAQYLSLSAPITALYRPPKKTWLRQLVQAGRQRGQMRMAPADASGVRLLVKALRKGEAVGMLPDQAPKEGEGIWCPFFGQPAYTMTLAARLSETQAVTLCVWAERLPDAAGYHLHFSEPAVTLEGDTATRAARINLAMEALIRQCPEQYLWGYNRYKRPRGAPPPPTT